MKNRFGGSTLITFLVLFLDLSSWKELWCTRGLLTVNPSQVNIRIDVVGKDLILP
jgi:hypothetical protein